MTDARSILARLRDGETLSEAELFWFAEGLATGAVTDAQAGAFAMAVCARGLGAEGPGATDRGHARIGARAALGP